jgi:predicted small lipoprotein YifL
MTNLSRILPVLAFMIAVAACGGGGPSADDIDATRSNETSRIYP